MGFPTARRASSRCPTSRRPNPPTAEYPFWLADRTRAGALAFRHDDAPGARALPFVSRCGGVHASGRCGCTQTAARRRGEGAIPPRLHPHPGRDARAQQDAAQRRVRALVRREPTHQQGDAGRDRSDLAADRLQEMRRARSSGRETCHETIRILALAAAFAIAATGLLAQTQSACVARRRSTPRGRHRA